MGVQLLWSVLKKNVIQPITQVSIASFDTKTNASGSTIHTLAGIQAGALLVLTCAGEKDATNSTVTSSPSLTWTKRADASAVQSGDAEIHTAVFTAGGSITVTSNFGAVAQSSVCYVLTAQESSLGGASATVTNQTTPSLGIATTRTNSLIFGVTSDYNAVSNATAAIRDPSAVQKLTHYLTGAYTAYHYIRQGTSMATYTEGYTAPTTMKAGTALLEIRGVGVVIPDVTPPGAFTLSTSSVGSTTIGLTWTASIDDVGISEYEIFVNGVSNGSTTNTNYTVNSLTALTLYSIYVKAKDAAGNSTNSNTITPTTGAAGSRNNLIFDSGFEGTVENDNALASAKCDPNGGVYGWNTRTNDYLQRFTNCQSSTVYAVRKSTSISNEGSGSLRHEVRSSDPLSSSSIRSEVTPRQTLTNGTYDDSGTMWYGWSIYLENWLNDQSQEHIMQWHPNDSQGSALLALYTAYGQARIVRGDPAGGQRGFDTDLGIWNNTWCHWVFNVKWSTGTDGFIKVWKNGVQVVNDVNVRTSYGGGQYLKVGINKFGWTIGQFGAATSRIFYVDNIRVGNASATYNDVAPIQI